MPIINFINETVQLEFGYGDIAVAPGMLETEDVVGTVCFFRNESPKEIGEHEQYTPNKWIDREDTPVRMTFEKVESIDVVLWALMEAKKLMIAKKEQLEG